MVIEHGSGEWGSLNIVAPGVESADDAEELAIVNLVILFHRGEGLRNKGTRVSDVVYVVLVEDCTSSKQRGIGFDLVGFGVIRDKEYWEVSETGFEIIEGGFSFWGSMPGSHFQ